MALQVSTFVVTAADFQNEAQNFHQRCDRTASLEPTDILVGARIEDEVVGLVRLCFESGTYVLRTMQVTEHYQRLGIGHIMLQRFRELLREKDIYGRSWVYCMPYAHLEKFYGHIGFKKISASDAPLFLQLRASEFAARHPTQSVIFMGLKPTMTVNY